MKYQLQMKSDWPCLLLYSHSYVHVAGENRIIIVPGANLRITAEDVENAEDLIKRSKVLLCQNEVSQNATVCALRLARKLGGEMKETLNTIIWENTLWFRGFRVCPMPSFKSNVFIFSFFLHAFASIVNWNHLYKTILWHTYGKLCSVI